MSKTVVRVPFYRLKHCQTVAANGKTVFAVTVFVPFSRQKQCSGQCQTSSVTSMGRFVPEPAAKPVVDAPAEETEEEMLARVTSGHPMDGGRPVGWIAANSLIIDIDVTDDV